MAALNKLQKFKEVESFPNVIEAGFSDVFKNDHILKGNWNRDFFRNDNPITLELACGKGDYALGLAKKYPHRNFIGIDIKGARIWKGAKEALENNIQNVAFIRTRIEMIASFFAKGEVQEIWITFPDPQMRKKRASNRLTSTAFLQRYRQFLKPEGLVHLKTDSAFFFTYTRAVADLNELEITGISGDLYHEDSPEDFTEIRTFYERQWLEKEIPIKRISFKIPQDNELTEPDFEMQHDGYISYNRKLRKKLD